MKTLGCLFLLALGAFAADGELRIGLSPSGEKKARFDANVELCVAALGGKRDEKWGELSGSERSEALGAVAWSKAESKLREKAIRELARQSPSDDKDAAGLKSLASVAVAEGDGNLRALARKALVARGDDKRTAKMLVGAMQIDDALIKANTLEAMKELGGPRVLEVIIEHWKTYWGPSARDHIFVGTQRSYVADYEISGDSYDPVVRSFMTGVVLDAKVLQVEADVYYVWVREVAGAQKLGNDPLVWEKWVKKNGPLLVRQAEANRAGAVEFFKE